MEYGLLKFFHLVGAVLMGGGLIGVWMADLRSRQLHELKPFSEAVRNIAVFYDGLVVPGALLLLASGTWLIVNFYGPSVEKTKTISMALQKSKLSTKRRELHTFSCFRRGLMVSSVLAGMMVMTVGNLEAEDVGNPNEGRRLAHTLCAECHLVDKLPGQQSPNLIAPTFEHIANTPGMNSAALTAALRTSHESMPNIIIKGSDLSDVIAYMLSLRERR